MLHFSPHRVLTGTEASEWDAYSIKEKNIDSRLLMGWAGYSAFNTLRKYAFMKQARDIVLLAGKGNNGGDGYVIIYQLLAAGYQGRVHIYRQGEPKTEDAAYFAGLVEQFSDIVTYHSVVPEIEPGSVIIDALLGTGLNKPLREDILQILKKVNRVSAIRVAVDIPTGIFSDASTFNHEVFEADYTITFGSYKKGHLVEPGILHCGSVEVLDIGFFPKQLPERYVFQALEKDRLQPLRSRDAHKYRSGVLHILGGSNSMEGAAIMSARAFLSLGGGLAKIFTDSDDRQKILSENPEIMVTAESKRESLEEKFLEKVSTAKAPLAVIGPGLDFEPSENFFRQLLSVENAMLIFDGSVLQHLISHHQLFQNSQADIILTPHFKEAERLLAEKKIENIPEAASEISRLYNSHVYFKGPGSVLHTSDNMQIYFNSDHSELATGGTGDVLTGVLANLATRDIDSTEDYEKWAAAVALYLEAAGRLRDKHSSPDFLTPTELIMTLRSVL